MTWRPVLFGAEAERARALVETIATTLGDTTDPSLAEGSAGIALLHAYRGDEDRAFAALASALEWIPPTPGLFRGFAGIGFAVQHVGADAEAALVEIDRLVAQAIPIGDWELTDGAIGFGVYALERGDAAMVAFVVEVLAARVTPDGAWREDDHVNLGIAHGIAGAIAFLAEAIAAPGARALLVDAVAWLRARERETAVPSFALTEGRALHGGIIDGWCYGDVSTAFAFVRAGQAAGEAGWIAAGHALATRAARRTDAELATFAIEGGFCHGAIGRAHLFHRLGITLGDDELLGAARRWYARTTDVDALGLQSGRAGVALGLLAGYSDAEPAWDRAFLLR